MYRINKMVLICKKGFHWNDVCILVEELENSKKYNLIKCSIKGKMVVRMNGEYSIYVVYILNQKEHKAIHAGSICIATLPLDTMTPFNLIPVHLP